MGNKFFPKNISNTLLGIRKFTGLLVSRDLVGYVIGDTHCPTSTIQSDGKTVPNNACSKWICQDKLLYIVFFLVHVIPKPALSWILLIPCVLPYLNSNNPSTIGLALASYLSRNILVQSPRVCNMYPPTCIPSSPLGMSYLLLDIHLMTLI